MGNSVEKQIPSVEDEPHRLKPSASRSISLEALKDITYGAIAGIVGKVIEYPFDTIKVRLQSQRHAQYAGPLDCLRQSVRAGGIASLYRGISAPLAGAAVEASSLFFSYRIAQDMLRNTLYSRREAGGNVETATALPLEALACCGAASGAFTSVLLTPIELVKCQMQVPVGRASLRGARPLEIVAAVYRHRGLLGFWYGQMGTLIRETGGSAAWFGSYEGVSALMRRRQQQQRQSLDESPREAEQERRTLSLWQQLTAGATAGVAYNFVCYPADTIKSHMQTEEMSSLDSGARQSFWKAGKMIWHQGGLTALYRGCGITLARAAPGSAVIFAVYEGLQTWLG